MNDNVLQRKGFKGSVEYSGDDNLLVGKILDIEALIMYSGESVADISAAFVDAVEDYLETCAREKIEPEKPYSGSFNVRVTGELHRSAVMVARKRGQSLNALVNRAIAAEVIREDVPRDPRIVTTKFSTIGQMGAIFGGPESRFESDNMMETDLVVERYLAKMARRTVRTRDSAN
jgi:predicted HicB family RNase H-like nuclease